jgi:hypothetical protein
VSFRSAKEILAAIPEARIILLTVHVGGLLCVTGPLRRGVLSWLYNPSLGLRREKGRQAHRFAVSLGVVVSTGKAYYVVETQNVSEKGLCLRSKKAFPIGAEHRMVFGQPPKLPRIDAVGTVRWSETGKGVGVEFTSISPRDQRTLREFLSSRS